MAVDDDVIREFLVESHENLDQLDRDFVALETHPTDRERLGAIFRTIHTIKGTAGFLGLSRLESLTHAGESLLSMLRDGELTLTPEMTSTLLLMVDRVRSMLASIEATGKEGNTPTDDVTATLRALREGKPPVTLEKKAPPPEVPPPVEVQAPAPAPRDESQAPAKVEVPVETPPAPTTEAVPQETGSTVSDSNVRVDVGLLDRLMNLVGELVLARNQILQVGARIEDPAFVSTSQRLNLITTELQENVMKTRMQPIGNVWGKLPRVVRDLAVNCSKQVRIEMAGKETELDRTVLEAIKDPLTHIVRNAIDHGIETPEVRASKGKPKTGTLRLRAFHEGGQVNIEISDDGAGLDVDVIRRKAIERNLLTPDRAGYMSEHELIQFIFVPGFSTAAKVTNVSGRGVGMDVVKTNIERIGGTVDLASRAGQGTTIKIKIPLTLAIVPALTVTSGGYQYAIPQVSLLELVRLEGDQASTVIERVHGTPVYRLRGRLLPLVFLNEQLRLKAQVEASGESVPTNIVVLQADDRQFGLVVDEVRDTEEIVVKPLGKELKGIPIFAGATIMGDGRVALILDVMGLAQHAGAVGRVRERLDALRKNSGSTELTSEEREALLLFGVDGAGTMALPLSMVARLEEFPVAKLERAGKRHVVQYRGEILPLIDLSEALGAPRTKSAESVHVIVYSDGRRSVGFIVGRILDVVDDVLRVERGTSQNGTLGAAIIQGRVTDVLDVQGLSVVMTLRSSRWQHEHGTNRG